MTEWEKVSILKEDWLLIKAKKGKTTFGDYIHKAVREHSKTMDKLNQAETRIKELELKIETLNAQQPQCEPQVNSQEVSTTHDLAIPVQPVKPMSDVSTEPPTLAQRAETNPALKQLIQHCKEAEQRQDINNLPLPPCNFCSQGFIHKQTGVRFIFCDNKSHKPRGKGSPITVPFTSCQKCYERKQYVLENPEKFKQKQMYNKVVEQQGGPRIFRGDMGDADGDPEYVSDRFGWR